MEGNRARRKPCRVLIFVKWLFYCYLEQIIWHQLLSTLEVLGGVKFVGEVGGGVNHAEGVALRYEPFECPLVEDVDESLLLYHHVKFAEQCLAVVGVHFLYADTLADGLCYRACLTDFHYAPVKPFTAKDAAYLAVCLGVFALLRFVPVAALLGGALVR